MERILLGAIVAAAALLRLWNLEQNGWGAEYYSAAVRSMSLGWSNFLFGAFDPAGFISVDKPPVALWMQVLGVAIMGYGPLGLLVPEALEGVACVALMHFLVRRRFGVPAGLLAALFLAVTPVLVAVNRTNNTDSCLLLVLMLAAWALLDAAERARRGMLIASMALIGLAFNVKMLAAFIVLPTFFLAYFVGAPAPLRRRVTDLALAAVVLVVTSFSWTAISELTPAHLRPWVGGSTHNSVLELTLGHNAKSRFTLGERVGVEPRVAEPDAQAAVDPDEARPGVVAQRLFVRAPPGVLRLAGGQLAAQASWLAPLAVVAIVLALVAGPLRLPLAPEPLSALFWTSWALTYIVVYSALGGIVHYYYLSTLGPAFAALAAIGAVQLWKLRSEPGWRGYLLPVTLLATAIWQLHVQASALGWNLDALVAREGWQATLHLALVAGTLIAAIGLSQLRSKPELLPHGASVFAGVALAALLALPLAWSLSSVLVPGQGILPSADLYRLDPAVMRSDDARVRGTFGRSIDTTRLVEFLRANQSTETYLLATTTTRIAAPMIVTSGESVMAMGGYHGLDGAMTPEELELWVDAGELRFVMLGDAAPTSRRLGADAALEPVSRWVREHGRRVPVARWRSDFMPRGLMLYDLRPEKGWR